MRIDAVYRHFIDMLAALGVDRRSELRCERREHGIQRGARRDSVDTGRNNTKNFGAFIRISVAFAGNKWEFCKENGIAPPQATISFCCLIDVGNASRQMGSRAHIGYSLQKIHREPKEIKIKRSKQGNCYFC